LVQSVAAVGEPGLHGLDRSVTHAGRKFVGRFRDRGSVPCFEGSGEFLYKGKSFLLLATQKNFLIVECLQEPGLQAPVYEHDHRVSGGSGDNVAKFDEEFELSRPGKIALAKLSEQFSRPLEIGVCCALDGQAKPESHDAAYGLEDLVHHSWIRWVG
jgi:hypothetical protein